MLQHSMLNVQHLEKFAQKNGEGYNPQKTRPLVLLNCFGRLLYPGKVAKYNFAGNSR